MKALDTTVAIDHLRGFGPAVELLDRFLVERELMLASEIVRYELLAGARPREVAAIERLFAEIEWISVDEQIARTAGRLAQQYRRAYSGIGPADYLIAATAMDLDAELVTTNVRHFPMFDGLQAPY
jgi:predicted nucleic acid-binding protein